MAPGQILHMTGKAVRPGIGKGMYQKLINGMFGIEFLYSFVIIIASLMVYYSTKELYELTNHKGIKYFRQAFLFFAIAYFVRTFIKFFLVYFEVNEIFDLPLQAVGPLILFLFVYFSTMALFYLLYSVMYKNWKASWILVTLHLLAFIVALVSVTTRNVQLLLMINLAVLLFVLISGYVAHNETKNKKHGLYMVYVLLFVFWVLNVIDILVPNVFQTFQLLIYLASTGVFLTILYKVLTRVGK